MKKPNKILWFVAIILFACGYLTFGTDDPIQQIGILSMIVAVILSFSLIIRLSYNEKNKAYKLFVILSAFICPLTFYQMGPWPIYYLLEGSIILCLVVLLIIFIIKNKNSLVNGYYNIFIIVSIIYLVYSIIKSVIQDVLTMNNWIHFALISLISILGNILLLTKNINNKHSIIAVVTFPTTFIMIVFLLYHVNN